MKRLINPAIVGFITFLILKTTTFGWRFSSSQYPQVKPQNNLLTENLKRHVYKISHEIGIRDVWNYNGLVKAASYISEQFNSYGYDIEFQDYIVENKKVRNIIATKKGAKFPDEIVIVGAHYDSCANPGADDNASGIAGLLELARLMADKRVIRTVKFVAFVNEEPPFFKTKDMGSYVYAKDAKAKKENIKIFINLESIGYYTNKINSQRYPIILGIFYPNRGNCISIISNMRSGSLAKKLKWAFNRYFNFPMELSIMFDFIGGIDFSDHWQFWREGYAAVMVTDTAFFRNPYYHTDLDTWEKLDYEKMACVVEGLSYAIAELTNDD